MVVLATRAKRVSAEDSAEKKKRRMSMELGREIKKKNMNEVCVSGRGNTSVIILKQQKSVKTTTPAKGVKMKSKPCISVHKETVTAAGVVGREAHRRHHDRV